MTTINHGAVAPVLPSLFQLKGEVAAKRKQASIDGKPMKNNVALKEVARKYGFRSWETLEAAARNGASAARDTQVMLYTLDGFGHMLIVNRKLIVSSSFAMGEPSLEGAANKLASALGVDLERGRHTRDEDNDANGEAYSASDVLTALGVIDSEEKKSSAPAYLPAVLGSMGITELMDYAKVAGYNVIGEDGDYEYAKVDDIDAQFPEWHGGFETVDQAWAAAAGAAFYSQRSNDPRTIAGRRIIEAHAASKKASSGAYESIKEKACHVAGYRGGKAPFLLFEVTALSMPNKDPKKGSVDLVVEVSLEIFEDRAPEASYAFWNCIDGQMKINESTVKFTQIAQDTAQGIVEDICRAGIEVDIEQFAASMISQ